MLACSKRVVVLYLKMALLSFFMQKTYLSYQVFKKTSPLMQTLWVLGIGIAAMFIGDLLSENEETAWFLGCTALGFYAWLNAVISFFIPKNWVKYFFLSIVLFVVLSIILYFAASLISQVKVIHLYEYRTMYAATCVFYVLGMLVVALMKNVAQALRIDY